MADVERPGILERLKRRSVFRVGAMYVVAAWVLLQVADVLADPLSFPDWFQTTLIGALAIGFPITLALAWIFDVTPDGVVRSTEDSRLELVRLRRGHKIDYAIIGTLVIALALAYFREPKQGDSVLASNVETPALDTVSEEAQALPADRKFNLEEQYSIAVLPFANFSNDDETGFFASGLSEDILDTLANRNQWGVGLNVASRTASFQFVGQAEDPSVIAEKLKVAYVLEGSVRRVGDGLRITAQLIRAADGFHVWSKSYDRTSSDLLKMQAGVVQSIASNSAGELLDDVKKQHASEFPEYRGIDPIAVQHVFNVWRQLRLISLGEGGDWGLHEQFLKNAVEADPNFSHAWGLLAHIYFSRLGGRLSLQEALPLAHAAIDKAVELDPHSGMTLLQLGQICAEMDLDYAKAEAVFEQGLKQNPQWPGFHYGLAVIALGEGRVKEALRHMATVSVLDAGPEQATFLNVYAHFLLIAGENEQSLKISGKALNLALGGAERAKVLQTRARALIRVGKAEEAKSLIAEAWGLDGHTHPEYFAALFALTGERERAAKILADHSLDVVDADYTAPAYLALGEINATFRSIEGGIRDHSWDLVISLPTAEWWDPIRGDPRFDEMLQLLDSQITHTEQYLREHKIEQGEH